MISRAVAAIQRRAWRALQKAGRRVPSRFVAGGRNLVVRSYLARAGATAGNGGPVVEALDETALVDLATIAFNNVAVIAEQARLLKKYLADPFAHTVFDNSSDPDCSQSIEAVCRSLDVGYIRLPRSPVATPSESHGLALTWAYRNHLAPRGADYFGFLDHDVFPIRQTRLIELVQDQGVAGHLQQRGDRWYLWPGFCFFARGLVGDLKLDFMPAPGVDTGGAIWEPLYSKLDRSALPQLPHRYEGLREGGDPQRDLVEYIGDWLHMINASGWKDSPGKQALFDELLSGY